MPPVAGYHDHQNIIKIKSSHDNEISAVFLKASNIDDNKTEKTLLFSHGNAEDLAMAYPTLIKLQQAGYHVMAYDYQGYGTSEGWFATEQRTYDDIVAVYDYLTQTQHIAPEQIIAFGRSLGTGPSIYLAAEKPIGALILQSPFKSAFTTVTHIPLFIFDRYPNLNRLKTLDLPLLLIHGKEDKIIPFHHSQTIYDNYNGPKTLYAVEKAGHNNLEWVAKENWLNQINQFIHHLPN